MATHPIIALVCSTGGLDAVSAVLAPLPADLPASIIVLQHSTPNAPSALAQILDRRTALTVRPATEGASLVPGHVLVAPPGSHTLITVENTIALIPTGERPPYRPSADLLLSTLAITAGRRAVAVVLSGYGNDGATGATAVHHFGGIVIAATLQSSTAPSMPEATIGREDATDHIVHVDDMAALLTAIATTPVLEPVHDDRR